MSLEIGGSQEGFGIFVKGLILRSTTNFMCPRADNFT